MRVDEGTKARELRCHADPRWSLCAMRASDRRRGENFGDAALVGEDMHGDRREIAAMEDISTRSKCAKRSAFQAGTCPFTQRRKL
eukprot:1187387-Prorocentrum_minimum.AAC.2